ncbi:hypothetical protein H696_02664 [Fonticula alba]|uniref:Uncharacterized protein n=1 Tax=Fonticula alba TaxID=691883 RepID=A0A058Z9X2_FONAL|nr:hypothetical protein H696_02664 [Fonticula alba]KCV70337.1 hypothetical protein H696_02664 [Fonticula alba]|eukprot:XP_009494853.1 hypothetical protein H696_02664 [Fonticula alba]
MAASSRGRFAAFRRVTCTAGLLVLCLAALCRGPGAQALPVVQTPDTAASASGQSFVPSYVIMPPIKPPQPESFILELKAPSPVHNKTFAEMIERHLQKIVSSAGSGSMAGVALEDLDDRDDDWPEAEPGPGAPAVRAYRTALAEAGLGLASNRTPRARTIIGGNQYGYWIRLDYEYEVIFIWRPLPSKTGSGISRYPSKEGLVTVSSSSSTITTNQASVLMDSGSGSGRATGELPFPTNGTLPGGLEDIVTSVDGDEDRKSPQVVRVNNRLQHKGLLSIQGATADMIDDIRNWAEIKGIELVLIAAV